MQITKCTLSKTHISWDETFDISCTVKMGSGEAINKNYDGQYAVGVTPNNSDSVEFLPTGYEYLTSSISSGASKTFSLTGITLENSSGNYNAFIAETDDAGAARAYPIGAYVDLSDTYGDWRRYEAYLDNVATFLLSRLAPAINSLALSDNHPANPYGRFGGYVLGQSLPVFTADVTLDPLDPTLTATHKVEISTLPSPEGEAARVIASAEAELGTPLMPELPDDSDYVGVHTWKYTVTDSAGNSSEQEGTVYLWSYTKPSISSVQGYAVADRYNIIVDDAGNEEYVASDDGLYVRFSFLPFVRKIGEAGLNAWEMDLKYGVDGAADFITKVGVVSGTDAALDARIEDRSLLSGVVFPSTSRYYFTFTITDSLGNSAQLTAYTDQAGGYANIEKNGTAIGKRSTGTETDKKFEVAKGYRAIFEGGIDGVTNYVSEEVPTGGTWIDGKPIYRKVIAVPAVKKGSTATGIAEIGTSGMDTIVCFYGVLRRGSGGGIYYPLGFETAGTSVYKADFYISAGGDTLTVRTNSVTDIAGGHVIVEYTRTADAATTT